MMNYNKQEAGARLFMLDQGKAWNYKIDALQRIYNNVSNYYSPKYHYSKLGIVIKSNKPW